MITTQTTPVIEGYKRDYPLYTSIKIRKSNLEKIKARATRFNQSIDDLITDMILKLDFYEGQGYDVREDQRSW
jgi:DNA/RNA endonuclease G (NUC1)